MYRRKSIITLLALLALLAVSVLPAVAQDEQPTAEPTAVPTPLGLYTTYPSLVIGLGETINFNLVLRTTTEAQVVQLKVEGLPEGWTATFRGGGRIVNSVFVDTLDDGSVDLRLEQPAGGEAGDFKFTVVATSEVNKAELPIELTIKDKLPPNLSMDSDLPTLRGAPSTTFRYDVSLINEGDDDLNVNITAESSPLFLVSFKLNGQDVTDIPLGQRETKRLSVEVKPIGDVPAGNYQVNLLAQGADVQTTLQLVAEVTGQPDLTITAPDGRLSGQAYAGRETPLKMIVRNSGTAPARGITLSSSASTGWTITFEPQQIAEIPAGEQVEVTASIRPAEKAVAGDYIVTMRAQSAEGLSRSGEFRITVRTSTLWGIVGILLIAIAVGVVMMAVMRFGRR